MVCRRWRKKTNACTLHTQHSLFSVVEVDDRVSFTLQFIELIYFHSYFGAEKENEKKIALTRLTLNKFEAKLMQCVQRAPKWCGKKTTTTTTITKKKEEKICSSSSSKQPPSQSEITRKMSLIFTAIVRSLQLRKADAKVTNLYLRHYSLPAQSIEINKRSCLGISHALTSASTVYGAHTISWTCDNNNNNKNGKEKMKKKKKKRRKKNRSILQEVAETCCSP